MFCARHCLLSKDEKQGDCRRQLAEVGLNAPVWRPLGFVALVREGAPREDAGGNSVFGAACVLVNRGLKFAKNFHKFALRCEGYTSA